MKKSIRKTTKKFSSAKTKKTLKTAATAIVALILVGVLTFSIVATAVGIMVFSDTTAYDIEIDKESLDYTSIVYGLNEKGEYVECERIWAGENRIWVDFDKIPEIYLHFYKVDI